MSTEPTSLYRPESVDLRRAESPVRRAGPLSRCSLVDLPVIADSRGRLTPIEANIHVPFDVARVYYLYDVPEGANRGGHAHRALRQLVIAVAGGLDIQLDDGFEQRRYRLDRADQGLLVEPMVWRELEDFSSGTVCLVLASAPYDEGDYYRDHTDFLADVLRG